jgi:FAD/FMN-containing dehydrogenase
MAPPVLETGALDELRRLGRQMTGPLVTPSDPTYDEARRVFNGMIDRHPAAIARCQTTEDVVAALACARAHDLPVAVRCGGHSTPGFSTCDGGMVIDTGGLKRVDVDVEAGVATIGGGLTWGELDAATQQHGLAVTGGRVSDTGVTGLTLGSGSGWLERKYGISAQSLLGAEVVLADGTVVRAGEDGDADLLWALRGGGGNFGVVTELRMKIHPVGPVVLAGMLAYPREQAREIARAYRDFIEQAPDEVGGGLAFVSAPPEEFVPEEMRLQPITGVIWLYVGSIEEGQEWLARWRAMAEPALEMVGPMPYVALQQLLDAASPRGIREYFKVDWIRELTDEAIDTIVEQANAAPSPMSQVILEPLGGAMHRIGDGDLSLRIPDAKWSYFCLGLWPDAADDEANVAWARGLAAAMKPHALESPYPNFVSPDEGQARLVEGYGEEKYARLAQLKRRYDPDNVFRLNQNIAPAG